jgi:hypothetical protein
MKVQHDNRGKYNIVMVEPKGHHIIKVTIVLLKDLQTQSGSIKKNNKEVQNTYPRKYENFIFLGRDEAHKEVHTVKTGCTHSVSGKYIC